MRTVNINFRGEERHFKVLPETTGCDGCSAKLNSDLCRVLNQNNCTGDKIIFEDIEKSFTLDQIKTAWKINWGDSSEPDEIFIKALINVADPEYNEYKRLQSKFEV